MSTVTNQQLILRSLEQQWLSEDKLSWFCSALVLYSWFKGMLQEHLTRGKIREVIRHKYLACFGKSCGLLATACRSLNEFLLSFALFYCSAANCQRLTKISSLPLYHHFYKIHPMVTLLMTTECFQMLNSPNSTTTMECKVLMLCAELSVCIAMSMHI